MRRVSPPDGAYWLPNSRRARAPDILSLIGPDSKQHADYTYNGSDGDVDVSHGGLNVRPLHGAGSVGMCGPLPATRVWVSEIATFGSRLTCGTQA